MQQFDDILKRHGRAELRAERISTLQVNVGKFCNQTCRHCHVDAGPHRVAEQMTHETARTVVEILARHPSIETLDITGGAPELNAEFRFLVSEATALGRHVIDRCNLTVLYQDGQSDLLRFLAGMNVHVIASLPCYTEENVDRQRGKGVFAASLAALKALNALGYGAEQSGLRLDLVYNPLGPSLPPPQAALEQDYKRELGKLGVTFTSLLTITNMPIARFKLDLQHAGKLETYAELLENKFNPSAVDDVMCRSLISVSWDGRLFDCDFNQMLELPLAEPSLGHIRDFNLAALQHRKIRTAAHCLGCTAGAGSSCSGAILSGVT